MSSPHFSFTLPLNCFQLPSKRFQSMAVSPCYSRIANATEDAKFRLETRLARDALPRRNNEDEGHFVAISGTSVL